MSDTLRIDPRETPTRDLHQFILGCVAPRPIAFASTLDEQGVPNLAPYSFFNAFSSNPPILIFSSNRRVEDNTTKDTLHNVRTTGEVVINMVSYDIVRQMALTSVEYPPDVDEFNMAGLTPVPSEKVKPFGVAESPARIECKVQQIITLGEHGGAGHLIICEVVMMHVKKSVMDDKNRIDPDKIDLMGRMGRSYYVRASGSAIHTIVQSVSKIGIGFQAWPDSIRHSDILTGNNLAQLSALTELPTREELEDAVTKHPEWKQWLDEKDREACHREAKRLLDETDDAVTASQLLLLADRSIR